MRSFFDLVGFEYKKIFKRKGAVVAIAIIMLLSLIGPIGVFIGNIYIDGELFESNYQAMTKDRSHARALSGRSIDETLLTETKDAFEKIPLSKINEIFMIIPEYQEHGRPYKGIYNIANDIYGGNLQLMQNLTQEQMQNFYQIRHKIISDNINAMDISDKSKDKLIQLDSEIQTPLIFDYIGGYEYFFQMLYSTGIFAAFAIAICLAPMFAGEYGTHTDQLILSSKFGKNKLIIAKLFTGVSFCAIFSAIITIMTYLAGSVIFGFDGANAPIQLFYIFSIYPMTILQGAVACSICVLFAAILVGGITLLLSSVFKSPFGVIIIISLLIFVPMMIQAPDNNVLIWNLFRLLPVNIMWVAMSLIDYLPYELFGLTIPPYVFMPLFAALASAVTLPFAYSAFKNHQLG